MGWTWLVIAIASTVGYHVVLKLTPGGANPYLSLAVTYAITTVVFLVVYATNTGAGGGAAVLRAELGKLNWTAFALGIAIVLLDLALLMMYRSGFAVSLVQPMTQAGGALLLLLVGVAFFGDRLSLANIAGIGLCVAGLWLVNRR